MWTQLDIGPTVSVRTSLIWILDESGLYQIEMSAEEQKVRRRGRENVWGQKVNEECVGRAALCWDGRDVIACSLGTHKAVSWLIKQLNRSIRNVSAVTTLVGRRLLLWPGGALCPQSSSQCLLVETKERAINRNQAPLLHAARWLAGSHANHA